jgi:hypothetical protein
MARIGVNALYLIPGGVGGTEIYLRELLTALAGIDSSNDYFVFTNLETGGDLTPKQANFHWKPQAVRARFRPGRILWEQIILPLLPSSMTCSIAVIPSFFVGSIFLSGDCCCGRQHGDPGLWWPFRRRRATIWFGFIHSLRLAYA